jgi:hypothetical protein
VPVVLNLGISGKCFYSFCFVVDALADGGSSKLADDRPVDDVPGRGAGRLRAGAVAGGMYERWV